MSADQVVQLLRLVRGGKNATFEDGYKKYCSAFRRDIQRQDMCNVLSMLLEQADLLPYVPGRLLGMFLLYRTFAHQPLEQNPFLHVIERANKVSTKHTPMTFSVDFLKKHGSFPSSSTPPKPSPPQPVEHAPSCIPTVVQLPWLGQASQYTSEATEEAARSLFSEAMPLHMPSPLPLLVPPPPLLSISDNEVVWMNPSEFTYDVHYDVKDLDEPTPQQLVDMAVQMALPAPRFQSLLNALKSEDVVAKIALPAASLAGVVEHNPQIATMILAQKLKHEPKSMAPYYAEIVKMDMSLNSMEVVNGLTSCGLPQEFLHMFISNCIRTCEKNQNGQPSYLRRLVRLVCVFVQSLIRNNIIDIKTCNKDLIVEVKCFCIQFSSYKEASGLYRLIRVIDDEESSGGSGQSRTKEGSDAQGKSKGKAKSSSGKVAASSSASSSSSQNKGKNNTANSNHKGQGSNKRPKSPTKKR
ncbi:hypothetical protein PTSG_05224 [Salpingoeca rosetta]|uniref:CCR4-NOT transcription complex subunit 11 n=1 Tax=Salpingoeca rosetta (strain ATCC 50818 / BSB-021) TaxID=946362 RepID=F2UAV4_SALR5|nr:uncharacterized protein PTSG_05224 [Salpingoeca rosetta]EGD73520.1 hypothetical protein PTSG_05224 [Salpingoeca rosetta]|eukprot:XP_004993802.1 hypothetical protein PTSG_05224 [Salpingoeca rosetta]